MPECVEAETTRRSLESVLSGRKFEGVTVFDQKRLKLPRVYFQGQAVVTTVGRHGKIIMLEINRERTLSISLGMSGSLVLDSFKKSKPYARLSVNFKGIRCLLIDPRRLGRVSWENLSPAGWDILNAVNADDFDLVFEKLLKKIKSPIKLGLMNQSWIAGLGNVYANEILFRAGVHPKKMASSLKREQLLNLGRSAREVLKESLALGGISMRNYFHPNGEVGHFQKKFSIYGRRHGEPCVKCRLPVKMFLMGQRSTFFCPRCQQ